VAVELARAGVGVAWADENLGEAFAPHPGERAGVVERPDGPAVFGSSGRAIARDLIDFDSEAPAGEAFRALTTTRGASSGLSKFHDISWPAGLAPMPGTKPRGASLPQADVLIVTWTVDEGHALSRVLTPGFDSRDDWKPYTKNYAEISAQMRNGCPAKELGRLGTYWTAKIGSRKVVFFKSDSHLSQDGPALANATVWRQIIEDCKPAWVITTGTGGGIGRSFEVGDVIVSRFVTFDCKNEFRRLDGDSYASPHDPPLTRFHEAESLFEANAEFLPPGNARKPKIVLADRAATGILTTDFFGFDNSDDTYGLQGKGDLSEMGDAVLGMVCQQLGTDAPAYVIVRNVSDPEISSAGLTLRQQTKLAADIYKAYGRWSSVCSAIACWAIVAGLTHRRRG
jgi:nucleoside phosphorylase